MAMLSWLLQSVLVFGVPILNYKHKTPKPTVDVCTKISYQLVELDSQYVCPSKTDSECNHNLLKLSSSSFCSLLSQLKTKNPKLFVLSPCLSAPYLNMNRLNLVTSFELLDIHDQLNQESEKIVKNVGKFADRFTKIDLSKCDQEKTLEVFSKNLLKVAIINSKLAKSDDRKLRKERTALRVEMSELLEIPKILGDFAWKIVKLLL
jgi:hypothetical protein